MKPRVAEFLLEIGCEEIPAGMIPTAAAELKVILDKYLSVRKSPGWGFRGSLRSAAKAGGHLRALRFARMMSHAK